MAQLTQLEQERPRVKRQFTREETLLGVATSRLRRSAKEKLKFAKKMAKLTEHEKWIPLAQTALSSPVIAGTAAFFLVSAVEKLQSSIQSAQQTTSTPPNPANQPVGYGTPIQPLVQLENFFASITFGLVKPIGTPNQVKMGAAGAIETGLQNNPINALAAFFGGNFDYTALKAAILLYIASGGNLAGLLSSTGGILSSLLKPAAVAAEAIA